MIKENDIFIKSSEVLAREIEDEILFILKGQTQVNTIYHLDNSVSLHIWKNLDGKKNVSGIKKSIQRTFAAERQEIENDLKEFLSELKDKGIIENKK